jgi:hypothetical protein
MITTATRGAVRSSGRGGIVTVVADEHLARQSRDFAVVYFLRHLRAP